MIKDQAFHVASYYGAIPAPKVTLDKADQNLLKQLKALEGDDKFPPAEDVVASLKAWAHEDMQKLPQPVLLWSEGSYAHSRSRKRVVRLDLIGTDKSIAEAMLLQTAVAILEEEGLRSLVVDINSIGSRDSLARFQREITSYYKKNLGEVSPTCKELMKRDSLSAHTCALEEGDLIAGKAPQSISFLAEADRVHFQEVLEFLETLKIDYRIHNGLTGHRGYATDTVFTISAADSKGGEVIVAAGSRYNTLAKKLGGKKEAPAVGITLYLPTVHTTHKKIATLPHKKPLFFFIQIGFDAKLKSLQVIETLRKSKIPLQQSLSRDKLSAQLGIAEFERFPFVLIMGQKEAMEGSVLVRDMESRSQETILLTELPGHLKGHLKKIS